MEIFQTIWTALTTPNEVLINILSIFSILVDVTVFMLLFTTILNITVNEKYKIIYVIISWISGIIIKTLIPNPYSAFAIIISAILLIKFILKASWLKSIFAEFIIATVISILEQFMLKLFLEVFKLPYELVMTSPLHRFLVAYSIYLFVYIVYRIIRYFKFHIDLENMTKKNKTLFIINTILGIISIGAQFYLITFYSDMMPLAITAISIISLLAYFFISLYSLINTNKLDTTSKDLVKEQNSNKNLNLLYDKIRGFRHDFNNIVQSIGGYAERGDIEGLKVYYKQLLDDCTRANNLTILNPEVVNNPPIYNILVEKYHKAEEYEIQINPTILMDLNEIEKHMKIYEFTKILGILMDNANQAASDCDEKIVNITFRNDETRHRLLVIIENTYTNKDIDIDKIFEKNFSTKSKETNSGIGLWEVRKILKKHNNLNLFTTKDDTFFKQQFEIYY